MPEIPRYLHRNGCEDDQEFTCSCILFRSCQIDDFEGEDKNKPFSKLKTDRIKLNGLSCNWDKYSEPEDLVYRKNGSPLDGCFAIPVSIIIEEQQYTNGKFGPIAKPVHCPDDDELTPNFAHAEIRAIKETDPNSPDFIPTPAKKFSKKNKLALRVLIASHHKLLVEPKH